MKGMRPLAVAILVGAGVVSAAFAQTSDERAAARDVVARRADAAITVLGTLKGRVTRAGQDRPAPDQAVQATATLLDASGLAVLSLSSIDPGGFMGRNPAFAAAKVTLETELSDVKMRLADGTELPAKIVLRDSDLDLLFVKPASPPAAPLPNVDKGSATFSALDPVVVVQRFQELAGWRAAGTLGTVEMVVEKPRRFYLVAITTTGTTLGSAVYDLKGQFGGIIALRASPDARHNALNGMAGTMLQTFGGVPVLVPASDIRDVASQAVAK
jgi:S1-C subfamily serine protease